MRKLVIPLAIIAGFLLLFFLAFAFTINKVEKKGFTGFQIFGGGDGSPGNPYQISTCLQLQNMSLDLNANYILINNINCSDTINWNLGEGFDPIGDNTNPFTGSLDGQGFNITDLFINRSSENYTGMFSFINSANIININFYNINVYGLNYTGGLAGSVEFSNVSNIFLEGIVTGSNRVGGLIGWLEATSPSSYNNLSNVSSFMNVTGSRGVGGLIGHDEGYSSLYNFNSFGNVNAIIDTGGVIGVLGYKSYLNNSSFFGNISSLNGGVGGLVGFISGGSVSNSYVLGKISGEGIQAGGLIGYSNNLGGSVSNSYSIVNVSMGNSSYSIGGFIGRNYNSSVLNSYSVGPIFGGVPIGGFVGNSNFSNFSFNFWDSQKTGNYNDIGDIGNLSDDEISSKITYYMIQESTFVNAGWDFNNIWKINNGVTYPCFKWQTSCPIPSSTSEVCGDSIDNNINGLIDEGCTNPHGSGGGGGGSGNSKNITLNQTISNNSILGGESQANFTVEPKEINLILNRGKKETIELKIENLENTFINLKLIPYQLKDFVNFDKDILSLKGKEIFFLKVDFFADEKTPLKDYSGKIILLRKDLLSGVQKKEVNVFLTVIDKESVVTEGSSRLVLWIILLLILLIIILVSLYLYNKYKHKY